MSESTEVWKQIADNAPIGIYIAQDGRFMYINPQFIKQTGFTTEELLGKAPSTMLANPQDYDQVRANAIQMLKGKRTAPYEFQSITKSGKVMWVMEAVTSIQHKGKRATLGYFIDTTDRKQAEETAIQLNRSLRTINDVNQLIVRETDRKKLVKGICQSLVKSRSYQYAWIALKDKKGNYAILTQASLDDKFSVKVKQFKPGEIPYCCQKTLDASEIFVIEDTSSTCTDCPLFQGYSSSTMCAPIAHGGKVYGFLVVSLMPNITMSNKKTNLLKEVADDISFALHSIESDEKLKEYSEKLEQMVEERTKELREAQDTLVRKEKMAILGQIAGGISHELRNPLGAIKNAAFFLNMVNESPDPDIKETIEVMGNEVANCERIINNILDFARPKAPTRQKLNINEVIEETIARISMPEEVILTEALENSMPPVLADPGQLMQAFGNIIQNAIQSMTHGGKLAVSSKLVGTKWIEISITDSGLGITEEDIDMIFEPLVTSKAKGIGLGLVITKTIIETHGGTITVESKVGKGTTFSIKLPIIG